MFTGASLVNPIGKVALFVTRSTMTSTFPRWRALLRVFEMLCYATRSTLIDSLHKFKTEHWNASWTVSNAWIMMYACCNGVRKSASCKFILFRNLYTHWKTIVVSSANNSALTVYVRREKRLRRLIKLDHANVLRMSGKGLWDRTYIICFNN